jgi:hypothetical protein
MAGVEEAVKEERKRESEKKQLGKRSERSVMQGSISTVLLTMNFKQTIVPFLA